MGLLEGLETLAPGVYCTVQQLYAGVQLLERNGRLVVASPPSHAELTRKRVSDLPIEQLFSIDFVARMSAGDVERVLGPAQVLYADIQTFRRSPVPHCRQLTSDDAHRIEALAGTLTASELELSGFNADQPPAFGAFAGGVLCAVASYELWSSQIAHITVVTHRDFRRQGHARAAISALADHALARKMVLQYRAVECNENSLALGRSLGFEYFCSTIYA